MRSSSLGAILRLRNLRHREFRLLYWLADHSSDGGVSVHIHWLAEVCDMSPEQVISCFLGLKLRFQWLADCFIVDSDSGKPRILGWINPSKIEGDH